MVLLFSIAWNREWRGEEKKNAEFEVNFVVEILPIKKMIVYLSHKSFPSEPTHPSPNAIVAIHRRTPIEINIQHIS